MERKAYRFNGKLYHPECLPENKNPRKMFIKPIFNIHDLVPGERRKCARCGKPIKL